MCMVGQETVSRGGVGPKTEGPGCWKLGFSSRGRGTINIPGALYHAELLERP